MLERLHHVISLFATVRCRQYGIEVVGITDHDVIVSCCGRDRKLSRLIRIQFSVDGVELVPTDGCKETLMRSLCNALREEVIVGNVSCFLIGGCVFFLPALSLSILMSQSC
jgi:hypothetical protein